MIIDLLGKGAFNETVKQVLVSDGFRVGRGVSGSVAIAADLRSRMSSQELLQWPLGVYGYHPSLLPRHRGPDAVRATISAGDRVAGGTVYKFDSGLDTGPVVFQQHCLVDPEWNASELYKQALFPIGVHLLLKLARALREERPVPLERQDSWLATRHAKGGWPQWWDRSA